MRPPKATPEQRELFRRMYLADAHAAQIMEAVNALPGVRITTRNQFSHIASTLGIVRSANWKKIAQQMAREANKARLAAAAPVVTRNPVRIFAREVWQWGNTLGLPRAQRGDLAALNVAMRREDPTHPGFALKTAAWLSPY